MYVRNPSTIAGSYFRNIPCKVQTGVSSFSIASYYIFKLNFVNFTNIELNESDLLICNRETVVSFTSRTKFFRNESVVYRLESLSIMTVYQ